MNSYYRQKSVLITGAASGIGKNLAEKLFQLGSTLYLWDIQEDRLRQMKESQFHNSDRVQIQRVDQTDPDDLINRSGRHVQSGAIPDILIHCAGVVTGKLFTDHTTSEIRTSIQVNLESMMLITAQFLPGMIQRGSGAIVPVASASGYIGNPKMSVYASTKWGVIGWAESLRLELEETAPGIRVTTIIPGYVDTGMFRGVRPPLFVPLLKTSDLSDQILQGVKAGKRTVQAPFMVRITPILRALLPARLFDWLAGSLFGVYRSMDTFQGRSRNGPENREGS
ncbi:MAG: SDR family NAD(P)-dependent oxidoreductase [Balneolaceae bacterium]